MLGLNVLTSNCISGWGGGVLWFIRHYAAPAATSTVSAHTSSNSRKILIGVLLPRVIYRVI